MIYILKCSLFSKNIALCVTGKEWEHGQALPRTLFLSVI